MGIRQMLRTPSTSRRNVKASLDAGLLREQAGHARHGSRVTFGRVCVIEPDGPTTQWGEAGEHKQ